MPRHLYSYNISYCMVRASACRWPPPGYKQLQEFNKDSRQMLLDLHSIYVKLRICCTFYTPGQRTYWPWWCSRPDCPSIGFTAPARDTRQELGPTRFTLMSSMHVWTYLQVEVLDGVHLGCHGKQQKMSQQKREAGGAHTDSEIRVVPTSKWRTDSHDQSEGSSPNPDELATASTACHAGAVEQFPPTCPEPQRTQALPH